MTYELKHRPDGIAGTNLTLGLALTLLVLSAVPIVLAGRGSPTSVVGFIFLAKALMNRNRTVVTLHEDHMEMKAAALASRDFVRYSEIVGLEERSPTKVFAHTGGKRYRLPLIYLGTQDQALLLETLRTHVNTRARDQWAASSSSAS